MDLLPDLQTYSFNESEFNYLLDDLNGLHGNSSNNNTKLTLPNNMQFNEVSVVFITIYSISFVIAFIGNLTVFMTLSRARYRKSRISLIIWHLSIADLLVACLTIPIEIVWRITVQWVFGNAGCKILMCLRIFGMYLSNNILICISLDRYYAVLCPLSVSDARRRTKNFLVIAWVVSGLNCIPQAYFFHVLRHETFTNFSQCVTFNSFPSPIIEIMYHSYCLLAMYFIPIIVIAFVYWRILREINQKSRESHSIIKKSNSNGTLESSTSTQGSKMRLRRSDMSNIERARNRALKMTIKIVVTFFICWTPYICLNLWYLADFSSAEKINDILTSSLFLLAQIGNPCANPLVYGSYAIDLKREFCHFSFLPCVSRKPSSDSKIIHRKIGSKFQNSKMKSPGVSKQILHSVRQAVQGLFKVGSSQTKSSVVIEKMPLRAIKVNLTSPLCEPLTNFLQETSSDGQAMMEPQLSDTSRNSQFQRNNLFL